MKSHTTRGKSGQWQCYLFSKRMTQTVVRTIPPCWAGNIYERGFGQTNNFSDPKLYKRIIQKKWKIGQMDKAKYKKHRVNAEDQKQKSTE